jgi:hypothetical protein
MFQQFSCPVRLPGSGKGIGDSCGIPAMVAVP